MRSRAVATHDVGDPAGGSRGCCILAFCGDVGLPDRDSRPARSADGLSPESTNTKNWLLTRNRVAASPRTRTPSAMALARGPALRRGPDSSHGPLSSGFPSGMRPRAFRGEGGASSVSGIGTDDGHRDVEVRCGSDCEGRIGEASGFRGSITQPCGSGRWNRVGEISQRWAKSLARRTAAGCRAEVRRWRYGSRRWITTPELTLPTCNRQLPAIAVCNCSAWRHAADSARFPPRSTSSAAPRPAGSTPPTAPR